MNTTSEMWAAGWQVVPGLELGRPGERRVPYPRQRPPATDPAETVEEHGPARGVIWQVRHERRRQVVQTLISAGDIARGWERQRTGVRHHGKNTLPSWHYVDGPARGCEAIDPWDMAMTVGNCSHRWGISLRRLPGDELGALALPHRCGKHNVCPVCAGISSTRRAIALQTVAGALMSDGLTVVHATFTQRARHGETLKSALDRLRRSWHLMVRGRPGRAWRDLVVGVYWGDEATRSWAGKRRWRPGTPRPSERAQYWHVHRHAVLVLDPGQTADLARDSVMSLWLAASARCHTELDLPAYAAGIEAYQDGQWWHPITGEDGLYQAAKYPSPTVAMGPRAMAEYIAVAHMRRWHHGSGVLRSVMRDARAIEDARAMQVEQGDMRPDLGESISSMQPGVAPEFHYVMDEYRPPGSIVRFMLAGQGDLGWLQRYAEYGITMQHYVIEQTMVHYLYVPRNILQYLVLEGETRCQPKKPPDSS